MLRLISFLVIISILPYGIYGRPGVSYVTDIEIQHKDGIWTCGNLKCPAETFGCQIRRRNVCENYKMLSTVYTCINKDKTELKKSNDTTKLKYSRHIDIKLETYVGAKASNSRMWSFAGETAQGVVPLKDWAEFKKQAEESKRKAEQTFENLIKAIMKENESEHGPRLDEKTIGDMMRRILFGF